MYKRVVLKLSGEALAAGRGFGVDSVRVHEVAKEVAEVRALVVGSYWLGMTALLQGWVSEGALQVAEARIS